MSIKRMSYAENPDWLDYLGFIIRLGISYDEYDGPYGTVVINKGSLIFGFNENDETYGYIVDADERLLIENNLVNNYITINKQGNFNLVDGDINSIHGLGANINGIPWYTVKDNENNDVALIGKTIQIGGGFVGSVVCDDAFWCEFEGEFQVALV